MPDSSLASATTKKTTVRKSATGKNESSTTEPLTAQPVGAPKKRVTRKTSASPAISNEERHHLIAVAAYFIAERNASPSTSPHDDWLLAEQEIDAMIAAGKFAPCNG